MTFRERLAHPFRGWTLRRRLVVTVVSVVVLLGVLIGAVSVVLLRSYLLERLDVQLQAAGQAGRNVVTPYLQRGELPSATSVVGFTGQPRGTFAAFVQNGSVVGVGYNPMRVGLGPQTLSVSRDLGAIVLGLPSNGSARSLDLGGSLHEYRLAANVLPDGTVFVVGLPLSEVTGTIGRMIIVMAALTVSAALIASGAGWLIVRLALRPLDRVAEAAEAVTSLPLDRGEVALAVSVAETDTDPRTEVGRVGSAFNAMLGHVASALTAREASEKKVRQFVSDASHELRTPLASIRGYSELTRRSPSELPDDVVRSIGRIESEADRMTVIVEDLLLLARLDEGRELDKEPVDLSMLAINLLSDAHAAGPDHQWLLGDLPPEPVEVVGDQQRLHQVFANLLTNARVHTPAGTTVTLGLAVEDAAADGDEAPESVPVAVVTVADDGPGIPEELQPVLFERFARGDSSRSRETGSTGLGLAIVQAVVQAHGGAVSVRSEPGSTRFRVELPLAV